MPLEIPGPRVIRVPFPLALREVFTIEGPAFEALLVREPRIGEAITVVDSQGKEFRVRILELSPGEAKVLAFEEQPQTEPPFELWLLQALPDKERMELVIQKATEIGVHVILPFKSARSISLQERESRQPKAHRWPRVALRATKQCRRAYLPYIAPFCTFQDALSAVRDVSLKIMLYERSEVSLCKLLENLDFPQRVAIMVGPEGGWDEEEVKEAQREGFLLAGLGGRILRTETASLVALSLLVYRWDG